VAVNNQPPIADAGAGQAVDTLATVTLDGSASSDPDGDLPLAYLWTQTGGPAVGGPWPVLTPTFTAPGDPAVFTFTLAVTDSLGLPDPTPDTVAVTVQAYHIYLPLTLKSYPPRPDLAPLSLTVMPATPTVGQPTTITLVFQNQGHAATTTDFWVDLYVDPVTPPQVNQPWHWLCSPDHPTGECQGGAWHVLQPVAPGQVVTLISAQFVVTQSRWIGSFISAGEHVLYAYVDSWNGSVPNAAITETDEHNNLFGPLVIQVQESE